MHNLSRQRIETTKAFIGAIEAGSDIIIILYEFLGEKSPTEIQTGKMRSYCKLIHELGGGRLCDESHENAKAEVLSKGNEDIYMCHAGLHSHTVPISFRGTTRSMVLFGKVLLGGDQYEEKSKAAFDNLVSKLNLNGKQKDQLHQELLATKTYHIDSFKKVKGVFPAIKQLFYSLNEEEDRLRRTFETTTHEMVTRLQPVLANAENLVYRISKNAQHQEINERAIKILSSCKTFDTVLKNLMGSKYLGECRFKKYNIIEILEESLVSYQTEAENKGVRIDRVFEHRYSTIEISKEHIEVAVNNLVSNAIKYSFRGGPGRDRFIRIQARTSETHFTITFQSYGIGILPDEILSGKLFEAGYQGQLTQGEYRTGSGMGLSFVKHVIDMHHGDIKVESEKKGESESNELEGIPHLTQFIISLPKEQK